MFGDTAKIIFRKMNVVYVIIMFLEVDLSNQNTIVQTHIVLTCIVCKWVAFLESLSSDAGDLRKTEWVLQVGLCRLPRENGMMNANLE